MNRYPFWKYLLILFAIGLGFIYATPNLYTPDPAIQISGQSSALVIDDDVLNKVSTALEREGIEFFGGESKETAALIRLKDTEQQLAAKRIAQRTLGGDYVVALNLAQTTPEWLMSLGAQPMKLGLDLSGGVHFLLEVDTPSVVNKRMDTQVSETRTALRKEKIRYRSVNLTKDNTLVVLLRSEADKTAAAGIIRENFRDLLREPSAQESELGLRYNLSEAAIREIEDYAVSQNLTTVRNRVNELGVSEPIVQRQGRNRIVVELPGVQDTAEAKRIIGKTANLEFRLEAEPGKLVGREEFEFRDPAALPRTAWLEKNIVITGDQVAGASTGFDENGLPQVNINLDSGGGTRMHRVSRNSVGRRLGVLFIEYKARIEHKMNEQGELETISTPYVEKSIISLATIRSALGVQFRITGLDNPREASELALLLRAGALAAPMYFVEERTIGPSLGAENIDLGIKSVAIGMVLVLAFMLVFYRAFGLFANIALAMNLVILIAVMSILSATLTLPGIAGIVLTVGMAVDANVLIFSRIREELKAGLSPQQAISAGYDRAFVSILDANVTTLIVAVILYAVGSGPVQGFAVTLSIGILTSMFTAIMGTRALVNMTCGGRNLQKLWI
ncbi:MAG: protein translocase subunit SecD [Porticoccaceae bacterium]|nr:protein translocase subunit SecD [Pseudomonadales bacterium]MCP5173293.1 protein translocase subunit SecD [Pseudomonadales bacterium]